MRLISILAMCLLASACDDAAAPAVHPEPVKPVASASTAAPALPVPTPTATATAVAAPTKDLSMDLYAKLASKPGNMMFSATSLEHALAIAYLGAKGNTATEMAAALGFDADPKAQAAKAKSDLAAWKASAGSAELDIANRLWLDKTLPLLPDYTKTVTDNWGAGVESVDFVHASEASRKTINGWVSKQTKDKIPELFGAGTFTPLTRLVITNAIYFKGTWAFPFDKGQTSSEAFKVEAKKTENVPMMHKTSEFNAATIDGGKVLELPYAKSSLVMDLFLPDDPDGLTKLESSMTAEKIASWTSTVHHQRAVVTIPKFTFSYGGSLKSQLIALGMKQAFTDAADFSGVTSSPDGLGISDVVQKTFIAVDEVGTEAAVATGVVMATRGMAARPFEFKADHPFVFAIRDTKTGKVLFMGRVANPKS